MFGKKSRVEEAWRSMRTDEQPEQETKVEQNEDSKKKHGSWWYDLPTEKQEEVKRKRMETRAKNKAKAKAKSYSVKKAPSLQDVKDEVKAQTEIQRMTGLLLKHIRSLELIVDEIEDVFQPVLGLPLDAESKFEVFDNPESVLGDQLSGLDVSLVACLNRLQDVIDRNQL